MTEDELLEQIQRVDPDAHYEDINGQRVLITTSLESNVVMYVNPASLHIVHMDPLELTFEPDDRAPAFKIMSIGEIREKYGK